MSAVAFLPWGWFGHRRTFAEFELIPFRRGLQPGGIGSSLQRALDDVLGSYCLTPGNPVVKGTLVTHDRREVIDDLPEDRAEAYFVFGELLAFAALASREYFGHSYWNRETYRLIVQGFTMREALASRRQLRAGI